MQRPSRRPLPAAPGSRALLGGACLWIACAAWPGSARATTPGDNAGRQQYAERLSATRAAYFHLIASPDPATDRQTHEALAELERSYPGDPLAKAYHGSLELLDVAHSWSIWNLPRQASDGLSLLDAAVAEAPDQPEVRFLRAATSWHLPGFYRRRSQCESDFAVLAGRAEEDARTGKLPPELAAASLNYYGQILANRGDRGGAKTAFAAAIRVAPQSPGGADAARRITKVQ